MILMGVSDYRKRYEAELAKATPPKARGKTAGRARTAKRASAATRAKEIAAEPLDKERLPERVEELLTILRDREEPSTVRLAALQALAALDFLGPRFAPFRADYKQALREVATDPERKLRVDALEILAVDKDPYAQELLVGGLKAPKDALVSEAKAIQLLGYDDHTEVVPLVREVYKRAKGVAREEALRLLAADPQSEKLFDRLLKDKKEKRSVREISASALQSLNPEAFEKSARKILVDESDYDDIRAVSLSALTHGREARQKRTDPKLVDTVQKIGKKTRSRAMRASVQRFLRSSER
jgi:hypothetical protein